MINLPFSDLRLYGFPYQNFFMTMKSAISNESSPRETRFYTLVFVCEYFSHAYVNSDNNSSCDFLDFNFSNFFLFFFTLKIA